LRVTDPRCGRGGIRKKLSNILATGRSLRPSRRAGGTCGRRLGVPLAYFPRLLNAASAQREKYTISGGGFAEGLSVAHRLLRLTAQASKTFKDFRGFLDPAQRPQLFGNILPVQLALLPDDNGFYIRPIPRSVRE